MTRLFWTDHSRRQLIAAFSLVCLSLSAQAQLAGSLKLGTSTSERIDDVRADYEYLLAEGEFEEAAAAAKLLISLLLQDPDYDRLVYAGALTELASAQHNAEMLDAAIENYQLAIEVITSERDRLSAELVPAMLGMSRAYLAAGRYTESIRNFKQTLHVHQVNSGLYGDEKAQIVAELSEAYFELGDFSKARKMQDSYVNIMGHDYPGDDLRRLPSLYSRADMLERTGDAYRSQDAYRRIIAMIERAEGGRSLTLLPAFVAISKLLVEHHIVDGDDGLQKAKRFMRRAVDIVENSDAADSEMRANVYMLMGDFLCLQSANRHQVIRNYELAWQEMSEDENLIAQREMLFSGPTLLNRIPFRTPPAMLDLLENASSDGGDKNGIVTVRYDVNRYGRPENVRIVESDPPELYDYMAKNHVRNFAFRPKLVDGKAVSSPGRLFELRYSYSEEDLPDKVRQNMETVAVSETAQ